GVINSTRASKGVCGIDVAVAIYKAIRVALGLLIYLASGCVCVNNLALAEAQSPSAIPSSSGPAYPLKMSANGRYLVDSNGEPFLRVGDAPQTLIPKLFLGKTVAYVETRRHYGINTLWINIFSNAAQLCKEDGSTPDGIAPFATPGDLSTPTPAY